MANIAFFSTDSFSGFPLKRERVNSLLRRQRLLRSTGSFSVFEERIVAPTPRKVASVSPTKRGEKRKAPEISPLFGEAEEELQSIFCQDVEQALPTLKSLLQAEEAENNLYDEIFRRAVSASPPLRSSNPIVLNTPFDETMKFHQDLQTAAFFNNITMPKVERPIAPPPKPVLFIQDPDALRTKAVPIPNPKLPETALREHDEARLRANSWPGFANSKMVTSKS